MLRDAGISPGNIMLRSQPWHIGAAVVACRESGSVTEYATAVSFTRGGLTRFAATVYRYLSDSGIMTDRLSASDGC